MSRAATARTCGCGPDGCDSWVTGCFQFRYGQCNQQIDCIGRIVCRVVACVPPWTVDPTCTTTVAVDNSTAEMDAACWTTAPPAPPPPPPPPCYSPLTDCMVTSLAGAAGGTGYGMVTSFGKVLTFGSFPALGDLTSEVLAAPIVGMAADAERPRVLAGRRPTAGSSPSATPRTWARWAASR